MNLGVVSVDLTAAELAAIRARLRRNPLYQGPCLLIERQAGLALDATQEPQQGTRPVLYQVHGMPWQHWRITPTGGKTVTITSTVGDLALTAPPSPQDWSMVHLRPHGSDDNQRWRLRPTDDGLAFLIEHATSLHALDVTQDPQNHTSPHLWTSHWAAWQQWVIVRLPIK